MAVDWQVVIVQPEVIFNYIYIIFKTLLIVNNIQRYYLYRDKISLINIYNSYYATCSCEILKNITKENKTL